jgi:hypothetical protein
MIMVLVDHDGEPILPESKALDTRAAKATAAALTFSFNSPAYPWSPAELATLQPLVRDLYNVAKQVYGSPAYGIQVNVRKDPYLTVSGVYNPSTNEMIVRGLQPDVICHEMMHAFRDDNMIRLNTFEEGMARAAEVEVFNRMPWLEHWDRSHRYVHDVFYDALNRPEIGSMSGNFSMGFVNSLLRYQLSGYAWGKVQIEIPSFFADFNNLLNTAAARSKNVLANENALVDLAEQAAWRVEGTAFRSWYRAQNVFNTRPPSGKFLYQFIYGVPDDILFYLFERNTQGVETMLTGVPLSGTFNNYAGQAIGSGTGVTGTNGWTEIYAGYWGYSGRMAISASAQLPTGLSTTLSSSAFGGAQQGVFGLVTTANNGTVRIIYGDGTQSVTVPVVNGVFSAPSLENMRGSFTLTLDPLNGKRYTKVFTKDAAPYFLYLDPR